MTTAFANGSEGWELVDIAKGSWRGIRGPRRRPPDAGDSGGVDLYGDRRAVGDDVEHSGAGLGLLDDLAQLLGRRIALDVERHPDLLVAVADIGIESEDAVEVDVAFDGRGDFTQLDAAGGSDVDEAGGQTSGQGMQQV